MYVQRGLCLALWCEPPLPVDHKKASLRRDLSMFHGRDVSPATLLHDDLSFSVMPRIFVT